MSRLALRLLGPPQVERDGKPIILDRQKAFALLVYLAVTGERHRRDALINLLWPESDSLHGRAGLRTTLSALKLALAAPWLDTNRETVFLRPSSDISCDIDQFHSYLHLRTQHGHQPSEVCSACLPLLAQAAALYRGDFLSGFSLRDSASFDDWQFLQAEGLRRELTGVLEMLVQAHSAQSDFAQATIYAQRWLALDHLSETAHAHLMRLYAWSGQRSAALHQYQECTAVLQQELGVPPNQSLTALYEAIRDDCAPAPPAGRKGAPASVPAPVPAQKRVATVLCARVGAGSALESSATEDEPAARRHALRELKEIAGRYQGDLAAASDESILAVFGLAHTRESDPELAVRAALEMRAEAEQLGLILRAGIATGEIDVDAANSRDHGPAGARGRAVDLALHLARQARATQMVVTEKTYRSTHRAFAFTPLTMRPALAQGAVYQVDYLLAQPTKARGIEGLRAELTGRDEEFAKLKNALALAVQGRGQIVSLIGEAGVGKSRLVAELKEYALAAPQAAPRDHAFAAGRPPTWLEGRSLELGTAAGYAPFLDILRDYFAMAAENPNQRRQSIINGLHALVEIGNLAPERAEEMSPLLGRLLSITSRRDREECVQKESPEQIRYLTFLALRDFFHALARRQPLVLVFEDVHWADSLSLDLISLLMEGLDQFPLLLLCAYRPGREYESRRLAEIAARKCRDCRTELHLGDLTDEQSGQLVASLLAVEDLPPAVRSFVLNRAQGNPFFIEETVRSLIEAGIVQRRGGRWRARSNLLLTAVPDTVQSVVMSRVDGLDLEAKQVLQAAAVIGRVFQPRVLAGMLPAGLDIARAFATLEERAHIYQERAVPEIEYSFKHVLAQQAVYDNILDAQRQDLHRRAAGALETLYKESLNDYYEQLAYHYGKSGNVDAAVEYLFAAGKKAKSQFAIDVAITHLTRAVDLLKIQPDCLQRARKEVELLYALGRPTLTSRGYASLDTLRLYSRVHELGLQLQDTECQFEGIHGLFRFYHMSGQWQKANENAAQQMLLAQAAQAPALLADAHRDMGIASFYAPDLALCLAHLERCLSLSDGLSSRLESPRFLDDPTKQPPGIGTLHYLAWALWLSGYAGQSLEKLRRMVHVGGSSANPSDRSYVLFFGGVLHMWRGDAHIAEVQAREIIKIATERGWPMWLAFGNVLEGAALAQRGQAEEAIAKLSYGIGLFRTLRTKMLSTCYLAWLADAYAKAGRPAEGVCVLDEAFTIISNGGERIFEAELYRLKGELLLTQDAPGDAEASFQRALALARSHSVKAWELRAATSMARLWQQRGKREEGRTLLQGVYGWFREGFDTRDLREAKALLDELT